MTIEEGTFMHISRLSEQVPTIQPCTEPFVYAADILNDPGFETSADIPQASAIGFLPASGDPVGWVQLSGEPWTIEANAARSGSQHAEWQFVDTRSFPLLVAYEQDTCGTLARYYSARVEPGDTVSASGWGLSLPTNTADVYLRIQWHNSDFPETSSFVSTHVSTSDGTAATLPSSYTEITHSAVAPANAAYALVSFVVTNATTVETIRIDDCVLGVTAA